MQFLKLALLAFVLAVSTSAEEQKTRSLRGLLEGDENRKLDGHEDKSHKKHKKPKKHYKRPRYYNEEKCKKWVNSHQHMYSPHPKWQKGGHRGLADGEDAALAVVTSFGGKSEGKETERSGRFQRGSYDDEERKKKQQPSYGRGRGGYDDDEEEKKKWQRKYPSKDWGWEKKQWQQKHPSAGYGWQHDWEQDYHYEHPEQDNYNDWDNHYPEYCTYEDYQYWCQFKH